MVEYGITALQNQPSLFKQMRISRIIDKRKHKNLGYFISAKYEDIIFKMIKEIEKKEKIAKLKILKQHQDMEFLEIGIDDGLRKSIIEDILRYKLSDLKSKINFLILEI